MYIQSILYGHAVAGTGLALVSTKSLGSFYRIYFELGKKS
jgi:hypothetical protein